MFMESILSHEKTISLEGFTTDFSSLMENPRDSKIFRNRDGFMCVCYSFCI